jgi:hypothetical protein
VSREQSQMEEAFAQPGCAICRLASEQEQRYLQMLLDEHVNDPGTRVRFLQGNGFCSLHARMALALQEAIGLSILTESLMRHLQDKLAEASAVLSARKQWQTGRQRRRKAAAELAPRAACMVCESSVAQVDRLLDTLLKGGASQPFRDRYDRSDGLCMAHLTQAVGAPAGESAWLLAAEQARLGRLQADLAEFLRKQDYRFAHEPSGGERDTWRRALAKLFGGL